MHVTFFPDFKSKTKVQTGPSISGSSEGVKLLFTARLDTKNYEDLVQAGGRLEVWTNLPTPHDGAKAGEWGALQFKEEIPISSTDGNKGEEPVLYLSSPTSSATTSPPSNVHVFRVSTTVTRAPPRRFYGFTYRVVYPSGVYWLGTPATNGVIEIAPGASDDKPYFFEEGQWVAGEERGVRELTDQERNPGEKPIAQLNVQDYRWRGWAIKGASVDTFELSPHTTVPPSRLIYLIPEATKDAILVPNPIVLRAKSWHSPISLSSQGIVTFNSNGGSAVERHSHIADSEAHAILLTRDVVSSCPGPELVALLEGVFVFDPANGSSGVSSTIYALPLFKDASERLRLPLSTFEAFMQDGKSVLFSSETKSLIFVDRGDLGMSNVRLYVGKCGGRFTVSPVSELKRGEGNNTWEFALVGSEALPELIVSEVENPLPTPPASPPPRSRHSVSFVLPQESVSPQSAPTEESTKGAKASSVTSRPLPLTSITGALIHVRTSVAARMHAFMTRGPIRAHIYALFGIMTWLLGLFIRRAFSYSSFILPMRLRAALQAPFAEHDQSGAGESKSCANSSIIAESSKKADSSAEERPIASSDDQGSSSNRPSLITPTAVLRRQSEASPSPRISIPTGLKWSVSDGKESFTLVARHKSRPPTVDDFTVEMDGNVLKVSSIGEVGERVTLMEVERAGAKAGILSVKLRE